MSYAAGRLATALLTVGGAMALLFGAAFPAAASG